MVPFVGPSYNLPNRPASVQRTINMVPRPIEAGGEKHAWRFKDIPGLTLFSNIGAEIRGGIDANGRVFVVAGNTLYELASDGSTVSRGTLDSASGLVGVSYNTTQLVIGDSVKLYALNLAANTLSSVAYEGNGSISFLDQYIVFAHRTEQAFGWTALGDATSIDALDFSSAEGAPDDIVGLIVDHREIFLAGRESCEVWSSVGGTEVFARNSGAFIETGCASKGTLQKLDGSVYWLGQNSRGQGRVYRLEGYREIPVSTEAIEEMLRGKDLSAATSYAYEEGGSAFYCLNVPGVDTTLCLDARANLWHERAELVNGSYTQHRARVFLRAFNLNFVGTADGKLYELDSAAYSNDGDPLVRDRVSPHDYVPNRDRIAHGMFTLGCDLGYGGTVMMRYSNDGGSTYGSWLPRSMGELGQRKGRVVWQRNGSARDRVWHVRCTDAVPFNPTGASS